MAQAGSGKKRKTVGLFISELENSYTQSICRGITEAAKKADVNVIFFPGKSPKAPYDYQYQHNVIYDLPNRANIDALIIASGTMINFLTDEEFKNFYTKYSPLPVVSISIPLENTPGVFIDNKVGMRKLLNHLIVDHNIKRIAYLKGPESNSEANGRFDVYKAILREHHIEYDKSLVYTGDFTKYSGVDAISELIDKRKVQFDAIAAGNDEMALSAIDELKRRGIDVPGDIAVVGFDDVESARFCTPSLSTVTQPLYQQARKALELATDLIDKKEVTDITLNTDCIIRESCGCNLSSVESVSSNKKRGISTTAFIVDTQSGVNDQQIATLFSLLYKKSISGEDITEISSNLVKLFSLKLSSELLSDNELMNWQDMITDSRSMIVQAITDGGLISQLEDLFHKLRVVLMESVMKYHSKNMSSNLSDIRGLRSVLNLLISDVYNRDGALKSIVPRIKKMGISSCYIYLYDKPQKQKLNAALNLKKPVRLIMAYGNEVNLNQCKMGKNVSAQDILNRKMFPEKRRYSLVISPLYYRDERQGFIVCEMNLPDTCVFESLVVEISCALKLTNLINSRQKIEEKLRYALEELETYNKQLDNISQTDELTGLLNRRGFLKNSRTNMSVAKRMQQDGILFFADLDGLKQINDTYGHEEGDEAIITVADILRRTFRQNDAIARLGGDEFTIFTINTSMDMLKKFESRIYSFIDQYNRRSEKPYTLSISIGAVPFDYDKDIEIEELLAQADNKLYKKKKSKKASFAMNLELVGNIKE
ncbi:GGDEF domain-containing protein [Chitinispirillales bacterium ANBcel5]|uniref:diguanylate cyclase n=1 Tax=Cellulosispirillum alkaliphilum TaxID=3039283 RepID=UPI002A51893F|nr:GGDEF domain-containing protein [Chitinispirillales bacterium ANBcel5]